MVEPKWNHWTEDFDWDLWKLLTGLVRPIREFRRGAAHSAPDA